MYSLYIDTHLNNIVVILFCDGKVVKKLEKESSMSHSIYAMNMIEMILKDSNISKDEVKEIYVVNGPGSFTGVRIGVTIAKTLTYCLDIKCKTITSLEIKAVNVDGEKLVVESEKNGKFIGKFNSNNELIGEYRYLSNKEYEDFKKEIEMIIEDVEIDYEKVYVFLKNRDFANVHDINPLYIKNIEV